MKIKVSFLKITVGSLLIVGLSAPQTWAVADEPQVAIPQTATATPTATATTNATATLNLMSGAETKRQALVDATNLLEIFPIQEPRNSDKKAGATEVLDEAAIAAHAQAGDIWVNSKSGAFHEAGTTYYGKTKSGFFLSLAEAIAKGYHGVKK